MCQIENNSILFFKCDTIVPILKIVFSMFANTYINAKWHMKWPALRASTKFNIGQREQGTHLAPSMSPVLKKQ